MIVTLPCFRFISVSLRYLGQNKSLLILFVFVVILPIVEMLLLREFRIDLSSINLTYKTLFLICFIVLVIVELVLYTLFLEIRRRKESIYVR